MNKVLAFTPFILAVMGGSALASNFPVMPLSEVVGTASLIVRATAESVDPLDNVDPTGIPCTVVRLKILEVLKGTRDASEAIEFCNAGGLTSDGRMSVPLGLPTFTEGSTYLLFLALRENWGR